MLTEYINRVIIVICGGDNMADAKKVGIIIKTPEELRVRIKTYAAQHRTSMQQVIIDAVVAMLDKSDER